MTTHAAWPHPEQLLPRPPRLFVLDVDGTVLTSDHRVTEGTKATVAACRALGIEVILASSRPPHGLAGVLRELELHHSATFVASQGAVLGQLDPMGNRTVLAHHPLPLAAARLVASRAASQGLIINWFTPEHWYVSEIDRLVEIEAAVVGISPILGVIESLLEPPSKLMFVGRELSEIASFCGPSSDVQATLSNANYLEVTKRGVSKASAVRRYCALTGISPSEVVAIGDGPNDLELFDFAGTSVAPANAHPDVLARATMRTRSNDDDGVAVAMAYLSGLSSERPFQP